MTRTRAGTLVASLALATACATTPTPPAAPLAAPPASSEAPPAPPPAPSAEPPAPPPPPPLDAEMVDDEPKMDAARAKLVAELHHGRHVVRGRVKEAKERRETRGGVPVRYAYAIVDILEWLRGDPATVEQAYRRSFALWSNAQPESVSKSPGPGMRFFEEELLGEAGKERLFVLNLPDDRGKGWGEPGPPAFIVQRWGKYSVGLVEHRGADAQAEMVRAIAEAERRQAWVKMNAARLEVSERFTTLANHGATAAAVTRFVERELARAGIEVHGDTPAGREDRDVVHYAVTLEGPPAAAGKLSIRVHRATGKLKAFHVDAPFVKAFSAKAAAPFDAGAILRDTRERLGLRARGGKLFTSARQITRGDGLHLVNVQLDAGTVHRGSSSHPSRSARVSMTAEHLVVFDFASDWGGERYGL